jgi:uncharacterized membrane protein
MNISTPDLTIYSLAAAPWHVHVHLGAALLALLIGTLIFLRRKGTPSHRALGWSWVLLMLTVSLTSFFIQARGRFSLIHVLSVVVLVAVPVAVIAARRGNVRLHKICMISTFTGLVIAGSFTLLPYRMLGQLVFG